MELSNKKIYKFLYNSVYCANHFTEFISDRCGILRRMGSSILPYVIFPNFILGFKRYGHHANKKMIRNLYFDSLKLLNVIYYIRNIKADLAEKNIQIFSNILNQEDI